MRSSVADSRGELSTEEILPGCGDDNGDVHRKETLGVDTALPEYCVKLNLAVSCHANLTAGATEVFLTCRAHVCGVQQKNCQMVLDTQTAKGNESPEIHGWTCTSVNLTRWLGHRTLTTQRRQEGALQT